jgi:hypothetical protein
VGTVGRQASTARYGKCRLRHERAFGEPGLLGGGLYFTELPLAEIEPDRVGPLHPLAGPPPESCLAILHGVRGFRPVPTSDARQRRVPFPQGEYALSQIAKSSRSP